MKAKNAIRLAMILSTKKTAFAAPCAAASRALASVLIDTYNDKASLFFQTL